MPGWTRACSVAMADAREAVVRVHVCVRDNRRGRGRPADFCLLFGVSSRTLYPARTTTSSNYIALFFDREHVASGPPFTALALWSDRFRSVGRRCDVVGRPDLDQMDWLDEADNSPREQGTLLTSRSPAIAFPAPPGTRTLLGSVTLRGDKKKHASRCNLRVRWIIFDSSVGAIAFTSQALSGHAMDTFIARLLYQRVPARQLPLAGGVREHGVCSLRARAGPG